MTGDPLDILYRNKWRLDLNLQRGWRCMYWCAECHLWRCVEESGAYHATPREAIESAAGGA